MTSASRATGKIVYAWPRFNAAKWTMFEILYLSWLSKHTQIVILVSKIHQIEPYKISKSVVGLIP